MTGTDDIGRERLHERLDAETATVTVLPHEAERENEVVILSGRDRMALLDALTDPPAPNEALRKAFAAHRTVP